MQSVYKSKAVVIYLCHLDLYLLRSQTELLLLRHKTVQACLTFFIYNHDEMCVQAFHNFYLVHLPILAYYYHVVMLTPSSKAKPSFGSKIII